MITEREKKKHDRVSIKWNASMKWRRLGMRTSILRFISRKNANNKQNHHHHHSTFNAHIANNMNLSKWKVIKMKHEK